MRPRLESPDSQRTGPAADEDRAGWKKRTLIRIGGASSEFSWSGPGKHRHDFRLQHQ